MQWRHEFCDWPNDSAKCLIIAPPSCFCWPLDSPWMGPIVSVSKGAFHWNLRLTTSSNTASNACIVSLFVYKSEFEGYSELFLAITLLTFSHLIHQLGQKMFDLVPSERCAVGWACSLTYSRSIKLHYRIYSDILKGFIIANLCIQ
jgi:hypothetical protein